MLGQSAESAHSRNANYYRHLKNEQRKKVRVGDGRQIKSRSRKVAVAKLQKKIALKA